MTGQGKLNRHIIFESVLMLFTKKLSKLVHAGFAGRNYSLSKLARFLRRSVEGWIYVNTPVRFCRQVGGGQAGRSGALPIPPPLSAAELSVEENWMCITSGCVLRGKSVAYLDISVADGQSRF